MAGNKDFLNILREIRGTGAPGDTPTDGIWYELTMADNNGNPGIYGDILAKYGVITENAGTFDQAIAILENLNVEVTTLPAGTQATSALVNGVWQIGLPAGTDGNDGANGFTPEVAMQYSLGNLKYTVTVDGVELTNTTLLNLDNLVNTKVSENVDVQTTLAAKQDVINAASDVQALVDNLDVSIVTKKQEINDYTTTKIGELDTASVNEKAEISSHADGKVSEYDTNATNRVNQYNFNHVEKLNEYNINDTTKTNQYNTNALTKVTELNDAYADRIVDLLNTSRVLGMVDRFAAEEPTQQATFLSTNDGSYLYYLNGVKLVETTDYTVLNETTIDLVNPIAYGDVITQVNSTYVGDYISAEGALTQDAIGVANGIAGLDANAKLLIENLVAADIKSVYESNVDTNEFTDAEKLKVANTPNDTNAELATKQDTLVNQTNIKSVNGNTLLGSGDLTIAAGSGGFAAALYFSDAASVIEPSYKTLSYMPDVAQTIETITCNNGETAGSVYLFELPIETTTIDAGKWLANLHCSVDSENGDTRIRYEGFMKAVDGTETTLFTATSPELTTELNYVDFEITEPVKIVEPTARYGIRLFANTTSNSNRTVNITIGDGFSSYTNTPLATRHDQLRDRDRVDSHPIGAITNLQNELDSKVNSVNLTDGSLDPVFASVVINGDIVQNGSSYETHAEQVFTTKDEIILRDGAINALGAGIYAGIRAKLYDGVNDGLLVFGNDGIARVGDEGSTQAIATREDNPLDNGVAVWNNTNFRFNTTKDITLDTLNGRSPTTDGNKLDGIESGATADQTPTEIKTAYESNADTNNFSDSYKNQLDNLGTFAEFTAAYEGV